MNCSWAGVEIDAAAGYRNENLKWSIADVDNSPNIISELTWSDVHISQLSVGAKLEKQNFRLYSSVAYGAINSGTNQDSDYNGDNRTLEFSRTNNTTSGDSVRDYQIAAGMNLTWRSFIQVVPLVGYSRYEQHFRIVDAVQTVSQPQFLGAGEAPPPALGPFEGLNSTFHSRWQGPWLGVQISLPVFANTSVEARGEYHWADFYASADWNLRNEFAHPKSFAQDSTAKGINISIVARHTLSTQWSAYLDCGYQSWLAEPGTTKVFFNDGGVVSTRLNEVRWESYSLMLGLQRSF